MHKLLLLVDFTQNEVPGTTINAQFLTIVYFLL